VLLKQVYHKRILIPFGETLPFGPLNYFVSKFVQNISYFATGKDFVLFKTKNDTPFITAICYEILFSNYIRKYLNSINDQAQFIVNFTNDSWYGNSAEPFQHLFLSKWRALEFSIPIVRTTNTGITSVIYANGSESRRMSYGETGVLDVSLQSYTQHPTFYQQWGMCAFFFLLMPGLLLLSFIFSLVISRNHVGTNRVF